MIHAAQRWSRMRSIPRRRNIRYVCVFFSPAYLTERLVKRPIPSLSSKTTTTKHLAAPAQTPGTIQFIRRVHAVIEVPVKEEDDGDNPLPDQADGSSTSEDDEEPEKRPSRKSARRVISYDDAYDNDDLEEEYVEEASARQTGRRKQEEVPARQKGRRKHDDDAEEQEETLPQRARAKKSVVEIEKAGESDEDELRLMSGEVSALSPAWTDTDGQVIG